MSQDPYLSFDDTDPNILYSSIGWAFTNHAIQETGLRAFNDTLAGTATAGATVHLEFTASQIVVMGATLGLPGVKSDDGPLSTYVLDGSKNTAFLYQANVTNATDVPFFVSDNLAESQHTLDITVLSASPEAPFLLDRVALRGPQNIPIPSTAVWVTTVFATPTSAPEHLAGDTTAPSDPLPVGAIVGGTVGGVALLVVAGLMFYFLHWKRRHRRHYGVALFDLDAEKDRLPSTTAPRDEHTSQIEPFLAGAGAPTGAAPYSDHPPTIITSNNTFPSPSTTPRASAFSSSALTAPHVYPPPGAASASSASAYSATSGRALSVVNDTEGLTPAQRKAAKARRKAGTRSESVQYHADSGVRFDSDGRRVGPSGSGSGAGAGHDPQPLTDVPPEYTEV